MRGRVLVMATMMALGATAFPAVLDRSGIEATHLQLARVASATHGVCVGAYEQNGNNTSCTGVWVGLPHAAEAPAIVDAELVDAVLDRVERLIGLPA